MPRKTPPNPEVVKLMREWLHAAELGVLQDVVLLGRLHDGHMIDEWQIDDDIGDMVLELRSTVIRMQTQKEQIEAITEH